MSFEMILIGIVKGPWFPLPPAVQASVRRPRAPRPAAPRGIMLHTRPAQQERHHLGFLCLSLTQEVY